MGNSASSTKPESVAKPAPPQKSLEPKKCCGGCHKQSAQAESPAVVVEQSEPVVVEQATAQDTPVVVDDTEKKFDYNASNNEKCQEDLSSSVVLSKDKNAEAVSAESPEDKPADEVDALAKGLAKIEVVSEASEFSIAGKALKLDTTDDVKDIVDEIKSLKNLRKASFVGNTLGIEASEALATALEAQETIKVSFLE